MYLFYLNRQKINNDYISDYENTRGSNQFPGYILMKYVLKEYAKAENPVYSEKDIMDIKIGRGQHGKPYFIEKNNINSNIHFSISHSGDWWACIITDEPVGFDIEHVKKGVDLMKPYQSSFGKDQIKRYEAIAGRFFSEDETKYIQSNGIDSFLDIWVRKEAFIKYKGTGITEGLDSFSVVKDNRIIDSDLIEDSKLNHSCYISGIFIHSELKSAFCLARQKAIKKIIELPTHSYYDLLK